MNTTPDLGSKLRDGRQRRGLTLHDIAHTTKIPTSCLAAIERNDFEALPGGIFRRAYVRSFAREVGVDPEPLPVPVIGDHDDRTGFVPPRPNWRRYTSTAIALALLLAMFLLVRTLGNDRQASAAAIGSAAAEPASEEHAATTDTGSRTQR